MGVGESITEVISSISNLQSKKETYWGIFSLLVLLS